MSDFQLNPRLAQDAIAVGDFPLSRLLLMNDTTFPWFILVPRVSGVEEMHELNETQCWQLAQESSCLSRTLKTLFAADKMNVAALGNKVRQLHVHHIVRYQGDPAWPDPVWGKLPVKVYTESGLLCLLEQLRSALKPPFQFTESIPT